MNEQLVEQKNIRPGALYIALTMALVPLFNYNLMGNGLFLYLGIGAILVFPFVGTLRRMYIPTVAYILFMGVDLLTFAWAPMGIQNDLFQYVKMIAYVLLIAQMEFSQKETRLIMRGQLLMSAIVALILVFSETTMVAGEYATDSQRVILKVGQAQLDPNYTCMLLFPIAVYAMRELLTGKGMLRLLLSGGIILLVLYGCLRSGSRGGLVAISVALAYYFLRKGNQGTRKIIVFALFIIGALIAFPYFMQLLPEKVAERFNFATIAETQGSSRFSIWKAGLQHVTDSFRTLLIGHGKGAVRRYTSGMSAHNFFVDTVVGGGLLELVMLIAFLWQLFRATAKHKNLFAQTLLVGYLVMSMSVSVGANMFFWTGIVFVMLISRYDEIGVK